jgi:glycosyltransferase involved in cell wall biosynthesis
VAKGDVVCFLDDDNTFHPNWLRSVAWLFDDHPEATIAYGARLIDDSRRHREHTAGGLPELELTEWDASINRERCLIDVNVLAHRRSAIRFDPTLPLFTDWAYLLEFGRDHEPIRLPVIATQYTTGAPDRVTVANRRRHDDLYREVQNRHAGASALDKSSRSV